MSTTITDQAQWDVVITADRPWWKIDLREFWRYRDLVKLLVRRDVIAVHKQTVLGPLWHFMQPLATTIIFSFMFSRIARLPTGDLPPALFYMSGLIPWGFFSTTLTKTAQSFIGQASLMTKVYFPRLVVPFSIALANAVGFVIQLLLLAGLLAFFIFGPPEYTWGFHVNMIWLPVIILMIGLLGLALGIMVAAATIRYRDLNFVIGFGVQLLMYSSPVIFPPSLWEGSKLGIIVGLNPMTPLINGFRAALFNTPIDIGSLGYSSIFIMISLAVGLVLYQRSERSFADVV